MGFAIKLSESALEGAVSLRTHRFPGADVYFNLELNHMPRVSVVIPTYNRADLIGETIASVLNQSYTDFELIVVDDGSTDNTREVVSSFNAPITYSYQSNQGISPARNNAIKASNSEYIALLDSDDVWVSNKLEHQVKLLESQPDVGCVYCDYEFIEKDGNRVPSPPSYISYPLKRGRILKDLMYFDFIFPSNLLIRRSCFQDVGLFDAEMTPAEDLDLLLQISKRYLIDYAPERLCYIRRHLDNTPSNSIGHATMKVLAKHLSLEDTREALGQEWRAVYRDCYINIATWYYFCEDMSKARKYFLKALMVMPSDTQALKSYVKSLLGKKASDFALSAKGTFRPASY